MEIAALVVSVLAFLVAAASAGYTRSQAKAARDQVREATRANDRLDRLDAEAVEAAQAEAEMNRVDWLLQHRGKRQWVLLNRGTDSATNVRLKVTNGVLRVSEREVQDGEVALPEMRPNRPATLTIVSTASFGNPDPPTLEIAWDGSTEPDVVVLPAE